MRCPWGLAGPAGRGSTSPERTRRWWCSFLCCRSGRRSRFNWDSLASCPEPGGGVYSGDRKKGTSGWSARIWRIRFANHSTGETSTTMVSCSVETTWVHTWTFSPPPGEDCLPRRWVSSRWERTRSGDPSTGVALWQQPRSRDAAWCPPRPASRLPSPARWQAVGLICHPLAGARRSLGVT